MLRWVSTQSTHSSDKKGLLLGWLGKASLRRYTWTETLMMAMSHAQIQGKNGPDKGLDEVKALSLE